MLSLTENLCCKIQNVCRSWTVMELKIQIFEPWKVWDIKEMVAAFQTRVHVFDLYVHCHCLLSDLVRSLVTVRTVFFRQEFFFSDIPSYWCGTLTQFIMTDLVIAVALCSTIN